MPSHDVPLSVQDDPQPQRVTTDRMPMKKDFHDVHPPPSSDQKPIVSTADVKPMPSEETLRKVRQRLLMQYGPCAANRIEIVMAAAHEMESEEAPGSA